MKLFLYAPVGREVRERVMGVLKTIVPEGSIQICWTIHNLCRSLQTPKQDLTITVVLAGSPKDLFELLPLRPVFRDVRIILVLPDTEEQTIAMAHRLRPRFLTYIDSNIAALGTVVSKMCEDTRDVEVFQNNNGRLATNRYNP
jgi:hypothetical protein